MLADWVFKFGQPELHLQDLRREGFAEAICLLRRLPVGEVRQRAGCVLDNDVLDPFLKTVCPCENALDAGRVRRDHANRCEADSGCRDIVVHRLEPVGRNLPGSGSHIGKNDGCAAIEMIDEGIKSGGRVDVDFGDPPIEKMLQGATRLVLCVEIEQCDRNLIRLKPLGRATMTPVFPTPPLPPIVKTTRFVLAVIAHLHWLSGQWFVLTENEAGTL